MPIISSKIVNLYGNSPSHLRATVQIGLLFLFWISAVPAGFADDSLWQHLRANEDAIELMGMESVQGNIVFIGARYSEERQKEPLVREQASEAAPAISPESLDLAEPALRKLLHIFKINESEKIQWSQSYPALPDNHEIFSTAGTVKGGLCLVYGEFVDQNQPLKPIVLQMSGDGKIMWMQKFSALRQLFSKPEQSTQNSAGIVANLDSIRIKGTLDNGCVTTFVSRNVVEEAVSHRLHVIKHDSQGREQWNKKIDTELYGKLLLERDATTGQLIIVQTNQSRNAAIEAMLKAEPFSPRTAIYRIGKGGHLESTFSQPKYLKNVWVNAVLSMDNGDLLLAGRKGGSWLGLISPAYELKKVFDKGEHEITAVNAKKNHTFVVATQDEIVVINELFKQIGRQSLQSQPINDYSNRFLINRMPDQISVEHILPVGSGNNYLVFFQLGARLSEIKIQ